MPRYIIPNPAASSLYNIQTYLNWYNIQKYTQKKEAVFNFGKVAFSFL